MYSKKWLLTGVFLMVVLGFGFCLAQTTGKITGQVVDGNTGEPLAGANISLLQTSFGAAADANGNYFILNIPPGTYDVQANMMGYTSVKMEKVRVSVNSTTNLTFELESTVLQGETVVVTASAISFKKDQTSSVRNISADEIAKLPVENVGQVVNMQAGVVAGPFRGGRGRRSTPRIELP